MLIFSVNSIELLFTGLMLSFGKLLMETFGHAEYFILSMHISESWTYFQCNSENFKMHENVSCMSKFSIVHNFSLVTFMQHIKI